MTLTPREVLEMDVCVLLHMSHHQMKSSITEDEFMMWIEYLKLNPLHSTDLQLTKLTMLAAAFAGQKNIEFSDFYVHSTPEPPEPPKPPKPQMQFEPQPLERTIGLELDMLVRSAYKS